MWTATSRAQHSRVGLRFSSDLTDAEWVVLQPLLPPRSPVGRRPSWPMREIVDAIFHVLRGGVPWRMLSPCFPPRQTVYGWFAAWRNTGVCQTINHHLVMLDRERFGREASPTAAVIGSQSAKMTEAGGPPPGSPPSWAPTARRFVAGFSSATRRCGSSRPATVPWMSSSPFLVVAGAREAETPPCCGANS